MGTRIWNPLFLWATTTFGHRNVDSFQPNPTLIDSRPLCEAFGYVIDFIPLVHTTPLEWPYFIPDKDAFADVVDTVIWPAMPDAELVKEVTVEKGDVGNGLFNFTITMEPYNCGDNYGLFRETYTQVRTLTLMSTTKIKNHVTSWLVVTCQDEQISKYMNIWFFQQWILTQTRTIFRCQMMNSKFKFKKENNWSCLFQANEIFQTFSWKWNLMAFTNSFVAWEVFHYQARPVSVPSSAWHLHNQLQGLQQNR